MGKGRQLKKLKLAQVVAELPVLMMNTHEKHFRTGTELNADNREDAEGKMFDAVAEYVDTFPVQMAINHERRLKKLVLKWGPDIIPIYKKAVEESKQNFT